MTVLTSHIRLIRRFSTFDPIAIGLSRNLSELAEVDAELAEVEAELAEVLDEAPGASGSAWCEPCHL
jgi:hypothetical protein